MAIITISRGTLSGGRALASEVAERLNFEHVDREELSQEVTFAGVQAALLEAAMEKPPLIRHQLERERQQYLAAMTVAFCKRAIKGDVVYNGHSGHMLLPGVPNILRVRVLADLEYRRHAVQRELGLGHDAAEEYIKNVDDHRDRWVRFLYGVDWHDPLHYDLIINLDQVGVNRAADVLESMARDQAYKFTPAVASLINDLYLANVAHFALLTDPRTAISDVRVSAREGVVTVSCPARQAKLVANVGDVLARIDGIREVKCTVADKCFLFIQQRFDPESPLFKKLVRLARRQGAAIELMYFAPEEHDYSTPLVIAGESGRITGLGVNKAGATSGFQEQQQGGISVPSGLGRCVSELEGQNLSGGSSLFFGSPRALLPALQRRARYDMVVLGELYIDKPFSIQVRLVSEAQALFADNLTLPVVGSQELQRRLGIGIAEIAKLVASGIGAATLFASLFLYLDRLLRPAITGDALVIRLLVAAASAVIAPVFAFVYGSFTKRLLRLLGFE